MTPFENVARSLAILGTKFDFWAVNEYATPEGEVVRFEEDGGACIVVPSRSGESFGEFVFGPAGNLVQFAVWDPEA